MYDSMKMWERQLFYSLSSYNARQSHNESCQTSPGLRSEALKLHGPAALRNMDNEETAPEETLEPRGK